jgi:hypothetical protein
MVAVGQVVEAEYVKSVVVEPTWTRWPTVVDRGGGTYEIWTRGEISVTYTSFTAAQAAASQTSPDGRVVVPGHVVTVEQLLNRDMTERVRDHWQADGFTRQGG